MYLEGQDGQRGYALAALLVAVAVMAVLMSAAMPVWRHQAQREKEAELAFRGEQWVKGLAQWARKNGPGSRPPSLDALVQQRMVRKKWKDPITGEDFVPVYLGQQPGAPPAGGRGTGGAPAGRGGTPAQPPGFGGQAAGQQGNVGGGIMGVRSSSTATSIRLYQGQTRYDQWPFVYAGQAGAPGDGRGGRGADPGGGRGRGRGVGPGGNSPAPGIGPGIGGGPGRAVIPGQGRRGGQ